MTEENSKAEEPEGLDGDAVFGWGDYPLDTVFVRTEQRTVQEVVNRINNHRYVLDPDFQRDFVWSTQKQSRLIESCLMRLPLPVFYVAEGPDGRIIVVDGLQRLTTFVRYLGNHFSLHGLGNEQSSSSIQGKKFEELPIKLQERLEDTQITLYILDSKAPDRAKLDIFERVNSGEPLTRQQMRNSLYCGRATTWLRAVANDPLFITVTGHSLQPKTMRDREAINRFCAFKVLGELAYRGDMETFLGDTLTNMNLKTDDDLQALKNSFLVSMRRNQSLFGTHAFRKSAAHDSKNVARSVINLSFFDVCSVLLSELSDDEFDACKASIHSAFIAILGDKDFLHSITYSTNSSKQVRARFRIAREAIEQATKC